MVLSENLDTRTIRTIQTIQTTRTIRTEKCMHEFCQDLKDWLFHPWGQQVLLRSQPCDTTCIYVSPQSYATFHQHEFLFFNPATAPFIEPMSESVQRSAGTYFNVCWKTRGFSSPSVPKICAISFFAFPYALHEQETRRLKSYTPSPMKNLRIRKSFHT